jgi:pimeloyl-ACP methyl ester carboxylesterase
VLTITPGSVTLPHGVRVHYERCGEGEPVVLLHGIAHSCRAWDRVIVPLAEHHDVIAIDLPGCGRSDKPDTDYSLGNQAAAVRHVLEALGLGLVTLVGHSLGGGVAMTFSYIYPDRVGRLGLISSAGLGRDLHPLFRVATLPWIPEQVMRVAFHPLARTPRNAMQALVTRRLRDPFFTRSGDHRQEVEELLLPMEEPAAQRAFLGMLRSASNVAGQAVSALDRLALAQCPVLILWGRDDAVFPPAHAERAAELIPHARLVILEGTGHFPQIEATSATVAALTDWLADTRPARLSEIHAAARG